MEFGKLLVAGSIQQTANSGIQIAVGNTASRPANAAGTMRYNTDLGSVEINSGSTWSNLGSVASVSLTGVTNAITVSGSPITTSGTFALALAGELAGINSLATTGIVERTGSGTYTTVSTLPIASGGTGATTAANALVNLGALPLAGGTMTGTLTLAADPALALQAATKSYVDNSVATAISTDTYTATASGGLTLSGKAFSANTTGVSTGLVSGNIAVRSTATVGQTLLSSGTAGAEASWGALNLASSNAVTGVLGVTNGGTGASTASGARTNLGVPGAYRTNFTNASLSASLLTVTHNLGQQFVHVMVTDDSNNIVQPDNITMTNTSNTTVDLTSFTVSGTWNVVVIG